MKMTTPSPASARPSLLTSLLQTGRRTWWLPLLIGTLTLAKPVFGNNLNSQLELRVAIEEDVSQVRIGSSTEAVLRDGTGQVLAQLPAMGAMMAIADGSSVLVNDWKAGQIWIEPTGGGYVFIGDKWYRGRVMVMPTGGGITAVNFVDLEEYLYSVVGGEMPTSWPLEALKAQAVAARTYALYQRQNSANTVFDVGDTTAWQVYGGIEDEAHSTQVAVNQTAGQVLTHSNQLIEAVFHSASGGHTENVEDVWSSPRAYLRGVRDFDQGTPVYEWRETISTTQLQRLAPEVGTVLRLEPIQTSPNGRISRLRIVGDSGSKEVTGNQFRQQFGLRSTLFVATPQYRSVASADSVPTVPVSFQLNGRGFGHGIGLSQWGAHNLAQQGYGYQQILSHYYTDSVLSLIHVE
jgi:stage II sporulation protein D